MSRITSAPEKYVLCAEDSLIQKAAPVATAATIASAARAQIAVAAVVAADEDFSTVTPGTPFYGSLSPAGDNDILALAVTAGQTYTVSLSGNGPNPVADTFLGILDGAGNALKLDDDGGIGTNSLITFTATSTGTYYIYADSFDGESAGDYRIDARAEAATPDVADTFAGAATLDMGQFVVSFIGDQTGPYAQFGDVDTYKVTLEAGKYYTFQLAGGADSNTNPNAVPEGELDTVLILYNAQGNLVAANDDVNYPRDISSGLGFLATTSGTYYLDVTAYKGQMGGYTLTAQTVDLASLDPLDSIRWVNAANIPTVNNVATVYFGAAGENFGEKADDGTSPLVTFGWNDYEKGQVMAALREYTKITGITYEITTDASSATFRLNTAESDLYGAYFYPRDPGYGTQQGIGIFNVLSGGWNLPGQASLQQGGYAFGVILHEFGHAHGLAHPHDNGGGSDVMVGVTGPDSTGVYDLNQGVYTVMSYNDAWETGPNGPSPYTRATVGYGFSGGLSAFDIAVLQERYGVHANAGGNTVYTLKDVNGPGTYYEAIWDSGGTDEIRYDGVRNARIDLLAATLDYTPTGGGVVSYVNGIYGGYTIAANVVIENATGGSGNDVLLGNAAANVLLGNAGDDVLMGRAGNDTLDGGLGSDKLDGGDGDDRVVYDAADSSVIGGDGNDTLVLRTGATVDLSVFTGTQIVGKSVVGFENVDATDSTAGVTVTGSLYANVLTGSALNDMLSGGAGEDQLFGGAGNDTLLGGLDADRLDGGAGDDRIFYDAADYSTLGGDGNDTLVIQDGTSVNLANTTTSQVAGKSVFGFENVDASGSYAAVTLTGSAGANVLTGSALNDTISGGAGEDQLFGGAGNDTLLGGAGADRLDGGAGDDRIFFDAADYSTVGGEGTDTLVIQDGTAVNLANVTTSQVAGKSVYGFENVDASGSYAAVSLTGSVNNNVLRGSAYADTLKGGGGYDTLYGGAGNDRFVFDTLASAATGRTSIMDLAAGDRIDLSGIDAITGGADNAFTFIGSGGFTGVAGQLHYVAEGSGSLLQGDVNGDGVADFSIYVNLATVQASYLVL